MEKNKFNVQPGLRVMVKTIGGNELSPDERGCFKIDRPARLVMEVDAQKGGAFGLQVDRKGQAILASKHVDMLSKRIIHKIKFTVAFQQGIPKIEVRGSTFNLVGLNGRPGIMRELMISGCPRGIQVSLGEEVAAPEILTKSNRTAA